MNFILFHYFRWLHESSPTIKKIKLVSGLVIQKPGSVRVGDKLPVVNEPEELLDPDTSMPLGGTPTLVSEIEVLEVRSEGRAAVAGAYAEKRINVGDVILSVPE